MSRAYDDGLKAGEESEGKERMSAFDASSLLDEFMAGYCMARADYLSAGDPSFFYHLGEHAGYYGVPKELFKGRYDPSMDYNDLFDSSYQDGQDERYRSDDEDE